MLGDLSQWGCKVVPTCKKSKRNQVAGNSAINASTGIMSSPHSHFGSKICNPCRQSPKYISPVISWSFTPFTFSTYFHCEVITTTESFVKSLCSWRDLCYLLYFVRVFFSLWELCVINEQFYALLLVHVYFVIDVLFVCLFVFLCFSKQSQLIKGEYSLAEILILPTTN